MTRALADRRRKVKRLVHNLRLLARATADSDQELVRLVDSSSAVVRHDRPAATRSWPHRSSGCRARCPPPATRCPRRARLASELGPAAREPAAGVRELGPAMVEVRPLLRDATPILRDDLRPLVREATPLVRDLRPSVAA